MRSVAELGLMRGIQRVGFLKNYAVVATKPECGLAARPGNYTPACQCGLP